jgi:phosphatidylserine/phosphatidylglycerophosphate/cardiolipin synthase-like enzyme
LDIAIYNFSDDAVIANAINGRFDAGVQIRIVGDGSTAQLGLGLLNPAIPIVERVNTSGTGIMHNKFMIIDADDVDNAWVWTGSMNWTDNNMYNDYNNIVIFQDQSVARGYRLEFEEMWGGNGPTPGNPNGVFGASKSSNTPSEYVLGPNNIRVESYFSPTDNANGAIIRSIQTTDANLDYAVLAFTRQDIADAIIGEDDLFLVLVRGMIEQTSDPASEYGYLQTAGQDVRSQEGVPYDLHHKYLIVDHSTLDSDPLVLTGSHNWSSAAQSTNDENTVVVHDARVANLYLQEFMSLWGTEPAGVQNNENGNWSLYPNPADHQLWIALPKDVNQAKVLVYDQSGNLVQTFLIGQGVQTLTLENLSSGIYHFNVISENKSWNKKVVVR